MRKKSTFINLLSTMVGAPCVHGDTLSLAICKPIIRKTAKAGSLIFGFAGSSMPFPYSENSLIYVASVSQNLRGETYYQDDSYVKRGDRIYQWKNSQFSERSGARFHGETGDMSHDLGEPMNYDRAHVLLSKSFRYFGNRGPKSESKVIDALLYRLQRGHRVNLTPDQVQALLDLKSVAFSPEYDDRVTHATTVPDARDQCGCEGNDGVGTDDSACRC